MYVQTVTISSIERALGRDSPQNGKPTTTDVDSGRLRVKKTNRPLPRCADEDLGFGTVRARYSERWERREAPAC
jgi:hypothetical protein